jgi:acyl-CoA reductase-like NAD-dependent aldehyde dehydrogenase
VVEGVGALHRGITHLMAPWKLILLAGKAHRGWKRIPPERRAEIMQALEQTARKHGPVVAKTVREQGPTAARRIGEALKQRKPR